MKKNIAMRVAAFLFILTMISTCAFATTFAKYTTAESKTETARVAKWGVEVKLTTEDLFKKGYAADNTLAEDDSSVVLSSTTDKVVAPGTGGNITLSIKGTPEVDASVVYNANLTLSGWDVNGAYCPLVIKVNGAEFKIGASYSDTDAIEEAVVAAILALNTTVDANESVDNSITVTWEWAFDGDDDNDTILGDAAAAPTITFTIGCTVTQLEN